MYWSTNVGVGLSDMIRKITVTLLAVFLSASLPELVLAQRIEDNSFLLEEAYNQEDGVVQHINLFQYNEKTHDWDYAFTQEWPVGGQANQFSYTLPVSRVSGDDDHETGFGDMLLNYRRQVVSKEDVAFAPRFSLILPTGDYKEGLGTDSVGFQANLPLSVLLTDDVVMHWNLGATYVPDNREPGGHREDTTGINYGASLIYLVTPTWNLMLEMAGTTEDLPVEDFGTSREESFFVSPGTRFAFNFESGLQIVPGFAFPIGVGPSDGEWGVIGYLSFEHPF